MIFITIILFTNLIGTVFNYAIQTEKDSLPICESEECYEAAQSILKWLEPQENPCDDFYEFSCGHWRNIPQDQRTNTSLGMRGDINNLYLKTIFEDTDIVKKSNMFETLKNFLSACLDEKDIEGRGASPLLPLLKKAGGWPVLDADWSSSDWDFVNTELLFGGVMIEISLAPDYATYYETFLIQIGRPSVGISDSNILEGLKNKEVQSYLNKLVNVAEDLGADRKVAEKVLKESLEIDIALAQELNKTVDSEQLYTLTLLQEDIPWLNWTKLLIKTFPDSVNIRPEEKISVLCPQYLKALGKFITQYPTENIANFILGKAVFALMPNISPRLSNGTVTKKENYDSCVEFASKNSLSVASASYLAFRTEGESVFARNMIINIKEELLKEIEETEWFDEETRKSLYEKITNLKLQVGYSPEIMNISNVNQFYKEYKINTSHSFEAKFDSQRWVKQFEYALLRKGTRDNGMPWDPKSFGMYAYYATENNKIVVSGPMLHSLPLSSSKIPNYISYGHLGTVIAHELIHAIDLTANPYTSEDIPFLSATGQETNESIEDELLRKWATNETEEIYIKKRQCFIDQYSSFNDTKNTNLKLRGKQPKREDMADNGGLKLSLRAYRKQSQGLAAAGLPLLEKYTPEQLFMVSAAMVFCSIPDQEGITITIRGDSHSPTEFRVKGMAMNSPDFSKAFGCAKGDPMNPIDRCEVWRLE